MRYTIVYLIFAIIFGCNSESVENIEKVVQGNDAFTANIYKELVKISGKDNIVVSGLSAEVVLSLLTFGAEGITRTQLLKGLQLPENLELVKKAYQEITARLEVNTENLKLLSANKIYPADSITVLNAFNDTAVNVFNAGVENIDYTNSQDAANTINQWIEKHTNNKIKNLIDPSMVDGSTVLVLVNALYFSARWANQFESYQSQKRTFYTSATDSKEIDTMYTETTALYGYNDQLKAKFLELEFEGGNVSMTFILPDSRTGLGAVEENLAEYLKPQKVKPTAVEITLPVFTIDNKINLKPILQSLGITAVFTGQADLSGISDAASILLDFIVQKAYINVNEEGVEAAAATGGVADSITLPIPGPKQSFKADHPFLFIIKENDSGLTLFAGRFNR